MKKKLVIIGGGATGACVALQSYEILKNSVEFIIVDPEPKIGLGRAYNTSDEENLLNVAASNMGIYEDRPDHFVKWLSKKGHGEKSFPFWPFVPRKLFGEYLQDCLKGIDYKHVRALVTDVTSSTFTYRLFLDDGSSIDANYIVVATGYKKESNIFSRLVNKDECPGMLYAEEVEKLEPLQGKDVLIIGSGLTSVDVWKRLRKDDVNITMISRNGLLPTPHASYPRPKRFPNLRGMSPLQIWEVLRTLESTKQYCWQQIADEVRIQSRHIWTCWSAKEKKQFMRHMKPFWEVIRHRVPEMVNEILNADSHAGRLKIFAGRIKSIQSSKEKIHVSFSLKKSKSNRDGSYDYVVLATGSSINQNLFKKVPGIKFSTNGFGYINVSAPNIWFAGPSSKAAFWEITAIPDIRVQAAQIKLKLHEAVSVSKPLTQSRLEHHPHSVGESYVQHFFHSLSFSKSLLVKAGYSVIHAVLPYYYADKTSNDMRDFSVKLSKRRERDFNS